jgi:hypothetical protein
MKRKQAARSATKNRKRRQREMLKLERHLSLLLLLLQRNLERVFQHARPRQGRR